jgi:GSH-dependent disulfide-bond oxidoreductase
MTDESAYTPPKVWTWNKENGGKFAGINRPIAGPTHDQELPVGRHPLQLYSLATPNGQKVTIMLEELLALGFSGAEYDAWLIRDRRQPVRQRFCRGQPELQDPGADRPQRAGADSGV